MSIGPTSAAKRVDCVGQQHVELTALAAEIRRASPDRGPSPRPWRLRAEGLGDGPPDALPAAVTTATFPSRRPAMVIFLCSSLPCGLSFFTLFEPGRNSLGEAGRRGTGRSLPGSKTSRDGLSSDAGWRDGDGVLQLPLRRDEGGAGGSGQPETMAVEMTSGSRRPSPGRASNRAYGPCAARPDKTVSRNQGQAYRRRRLCSGRRRLCRRGKLRGALRGNREEPRVRGQGT